MFASAKEVLKAREGSLAQTPFPRLLHALLVEERTCTLELKVRQLEKRITLEEGAPVACSSNLLHETLGKFLVERGKLTEPQYQLALAESVKEGIPIGELLVKRSLIAPFDLYKQLQANLAHKILDCFRWVDGRFRIIPDAEPPESPIRMNSLQLILTGVTSFLPFEAVASQLSFVDAQRFALVPEPVQPLSELKLSAKEARLVQLLRSRPSFAELTARAGLDTEQLMRRLYALGVMGFVDLAEAVPAPATPAPAPSAAPESPPPAAPAAPAPQGLPFADDDEGLRNALATEFLEYRRKDPFELLGVPEDVQPLPLRKAFLAAAERFSPVRYRSADLREKAEMLLVAYARAFGALSEPEQLALHRKRRQIAREAAQEAARGGRPSAAEQFKIRTDLLDANTQFEEGKKRLEAGAFRAAVEYFEYAYDIEPKARYRAYLAWARYKLNPNTLARLALQELGEALKSDAQCEEAWAFQGELQRATGELPAAEESFRKAFKLNPQNRRYAELIRELGRQQKVGR